MNNRQLAILAGLVGVFLFAYFVKFTDPTIQKAIMVAFYMLQWHVGCHTLACVVPAMFIAGAIATFFSKEAVLRHLGPKANNVAGIERRRADTGDPAPPDGTISKPFRPRDDT